MDDAGPTFACPWDAHLAAYGPPSLFTLDPKGFLRVDPERTRECYLLIGEPEGRDPGHFVLTDRATGLRMYVFATHSAFAFCQPRAEVARFDDYASARAEAVKQWAVAAPDALDGRDEEP
jgi:hypothetical protein